MGDSKKKKKSKKSEKRYDDSSNEESSKKSKKKTKPKPKQGMSLWPFGSKKKATGTKSPKKEKKEKKEKKKKAPEEPVIKNKKKAMAVSRMHRDSMVTVGYGRKNDRSDPLIEIEDDSSYTSQNEHGGTEPDTSGHSATEGEKTFNLDNVGSSSLSFPTKNELLSSWQVKQGNAPPVPPGPSIDNAPIGKFSPSLNGSSHNRPPSLRKQSSHHEDESKTGRISSASFHKEQTDKQKAINKKSKLKSVKKRVSLAHDKWFRWMCQTQYFATLCDKVFDMVDSEQAGAVDEQELYQGLLLIHLRLGMYAGPAACKSISKAQCSALFTKMDRDKSGVLDRLEFREVMMVLFGQVIFRLVVQWTFTLFIVPLIAQSIISGFSWVFSIVFGIISYIFSYTWFSRFLNLTASDSPRTLKFVGAILISIYSLIPTRIISKAPLTLCSIVMGMFVVPHAFLHVDEIFQNFADSRAKKAPVFAK